MVSMIYDLNSLKKRLLFATPLRQKSIADKCETTEPAEIVEFFNATPVPRSNEFIDSVLHDSVKM